MKNYEKYADEIRGYKDHKDRNICSDFIKPHILEADNCNGFDCQRCFMLQTIWLLEDYKEPEVDWSKVEVDTPILVRQTKDGEWLRRHFAKYEGGIVYTWKDSHTSWTEDCMTGWDYGKLAESEEE